MTTDPGEFEVCKNLFLQGQTTLQVQEYLVNKYKITKSQTSNYVRAVRKDLGIYKPKNTNN
jgi:uncharacterized protein YmfQ (DUF2313 family)